MMHEYAKDIKKEPRSGSAKPFTVKKYKSLHEVRTGMVNLHVNFYLHL